MISHFFPVLNIHISFMFPHFSTMYVLTIILECDSLFLVCIEKNTSAIKTSMFGDAVIADSCKGKSKNQFHKI